MKEREGHLNGLDGIRALCALIILWGHIPQSVFCDWGRVNGWLSITLPPSCAYVFFVLSGFLVGFKTQGATDSLKYYKKRAQRILPLYYGYIIVSVIIFILLGRTSEVVNTGLWYYLFLVPEVPFSISRGLLPLVHLWFVGVVVLFYIVCPLFSRVKDESRHRVAFLIALGWLVLKCALYLFVGKDTFVYRFVGVTSFDCLFYGVWLGTIWKRKSQRVIRLAENRYIAASAWILFLFSGLYGRYVHVPSPVGNEYIAALAGVMMLNQVSRTPIVSLENRVCNWLSSISYEIYVSHILVIMLISYLYTQAGWQWPSILIYAVCTFVVIIIAAFCRKITRVRLKKI